MTQAKVARGQCLCGAHRFRLEGELVFAHHCHCGHCRKSHGSVYASLVGVEDTDSHGGMCWETAGDSIRFRASEAFDRFFCAVCGSALPVAAEGMPVFVPMGLLDASFDRPVQFHIFVASKAPWFEIEDELPAFDAYPPGIETPTCRTREALDPPGGTRGSCLCGQVRYVIDGPGITARHCHCQRCRRGRAAAHATNLVVRSDALRFTAGSDSIRTYKVPEARFFAQSFCSRCGSCVPRVDPDRGIAIVPMGGLDDPPPQRPVEHIWVGSKARWHTIDDALPTHPEGPPP